MGWILYHENGFNGAKSADEVHALTLRARFIVDLTPPKGEIGRYNLPDIVGNVSRQHFSYRMDGERLYLIPLSDQGTALDGVAVEKGVEVEVLHKSWLVLGLSERFYVFRVTKS